MPPYLHIPPWFFLFFFLYRVSEACIFEKSAFLPAPANMHINFPTDFVWGEQDYMLITS